MYVGIMCSVHDAHTNGCRFCFAGHILSLSEELVFCQVDLYRRYEERERER